MIGSRFSVARKSHKREGTTFDLEEGREHLKDKNKDQSKLVQGIKSTRVFRITFLPNSKASVKVFPAFCQVMCC